MTILLSISCFGLIFGGRSKIFAMTSMMTKQCAFGFRFRKIVSILSKELRHKDTGTGMWLQISSIWPYIRCMWWCTVQQPNLYILFSILYKQYPICTLYVPVFLERPYLSPFGRRRLTRILRGLLREYFTSQMTALTECSVSIQWAVTWHPPLYCTCSPAAMSD